MSFSMPFKKDAPVVVCKHCGLPAQLHSTTNICPRFYTQEDLDKGIDPSGAETTWWEPEPNP